MGVMKDTHNAQKSYAETDSADIAESALGDSVETDSKLLIQPVDALK